MSDDLVKRLRDSTGYWPWAAQEAANRIEELEAKLEKAEGVLHTISGHMVLNNEGDEELSDSALIALATLAELKGEKE